MAAYYRVAPGGKGAAPGGSQAKAGRQAVVQQLLHGEDAPRPPNKPPPGKPGAQGSFAPTAPKGSTPCRGQPPAVAASAPQARSGIAQTLRPLARVEPPQKRARTEPEAPAAPAVPTLTVISTDPRDELGIQALICGEYVPDGSNHGRPAFRKLGKSKNDVRLYYWDERDGVDYSGWYFGDQVGGNEVWLLNRSHGPMPPRTGWTWREGEVRDELLVLTPDEKAQLEEEYSGEQQEEYSGEQQGEYSGEQQEQQWEDAEEPQGEEPRDEWEAKVHQAIARLEAVEAETAQVLESVQLAVDSETSFIDDSIQRAQELLTAQAQPIQQAQRIAVSEGLTHPDAPDHVKTAAVELMQRVRALTTNVKAAEKRLADACLEREKRRKEEELKEREAARAQELEAKHHAQLEELLRTSMDKVNALEDEVEKVEIAATPLEVDAGDGLQSVMLQAVKEVEQLTKAANLALAEGRRFLTTKVTTAKRLLQGVKSSVVDELTALLEKLNEAQNKLKPFGSVRQTFEQKMHAKKVLDEVSEHLAMVEVEVERAVMACSPVSGESCQTAKEAELALNKARTAVSQLSMLVEAKMKTAPKTKGPLLEGLEEVQARVKQMEERLKESQQALKDMKHRAATDALMHDISTKAENIEAELQKLADTESLIAPQEDGEMGPEVDTIIAEVEKVTTAAQSALATGEAYVKKMQADLSKVNKESKDSSEVVNEAISHLQARLDEGKERLKQFGSRVVGLRRMQLLHKVETAVAGAEADIQRLAAIAETLKDVEQLEEQAEGLKESMQQAIQAEKGVQSSIVSARKCIVDISSELRKLTGGTAGTAVPPEIGKLQQRMSVAQQEALRLRNAAKTAEERVKARTLVKDVVDRVQAAEAEAASIAAAASAAEDEESGADAAEVEKLATAARTQLATAKKIVAVRLKPTKPGVLRDMLVALDARLQECETKLGGASNVLQARKRRQEAGELAAQATKRVELVEVAMQKAGEAELPFLTGLEDLPGETAHSALKSCEAATGHASQVLTEARSFVAASMVDAKRLSGEAWSGDEFTVLQQRLDEAGSKLAALQSDMAERRRSLHQQIAADRVSNAEDAVHKLASTLSKFTEDKLDTEEAHAVCEELAAAEKDANQALASAKDFLTEQMKQVKNSGDSRAMTADIAKWQSKLRQQQVEFARLSRESQKREHRFVAQQMLKELPDGLDKLEARVETAHAAAAPLLSADKTTVLRDVRVQLVSQCLRSSVQGSDVEGLFAKITSGDQATKAELAAFLDKLPGPGGAEGSGPTGIPGLSGEQAATALIQTQGQGEVLSITGFQALFRERLVCKARTAGTDSFEGGTEVTIVEVGEIVEVQVQREAAGGGVRVQCVLSRDQTSVWVWLQGPGSGVLFEPSESTSGRVESIVALVEGVCTRCVEVAKDAEQKAQMCEAEGGQQSGPLAEVRPALQKLKMKANVLQVKMEQLRKRVVSAKTVLLQKWEAVQAQAQQIQCKVMLEQQLKEAVTAVESAESKSMKVLDSVKAGKVFKTTPEGSQSLDNVKQCADEALTGLAEAKVLTSKALAAHKANAGSNKNAVLDVQVQLMKLMSRITSMERKCRMASEVVTQAERKFADQARTALRVTAQKLRKTSDELFDEFADGGEELSDAQLGLLLESLPDMGVDKDKAIAAVRFGVPESRGLRRSELADVVQEFRVCTKSVTITDSPEIERPGAKKAKLMRMLEDGEFFQVLEGPREEAEAAAGAPAPMRLRGRALRDGIEGWATVTGNKGTVFLQPVRKPYMRCAAESIKLREALPEASASVAQAERGELLELLEGPREEAVKPQTLLHGKASKDGAHGWITFRDLSGESTAEPNQDMHICRTAIAMTDIFDIESCGIVRKINAGELLAAVRDEEAPARAEAAGGVTRRRFRAMRDGATGWVSVMGSQGTVYLEVSSSHFVLNRRTPLHRGRDAAEQGGADDGGGAAVRWLELGEVFEAAGPPQEGAPQAPKVSVRVRSAGRSGVEGWASWSKSSEAPLQLYAPSS